MRTDRETPKDRPAVADSAQRSATACLNAVRNPISSLPLRLEEAVLSGALFAVLAIAIYLPHIIHGGWYLDDWTYIARLSEANGPFGAVGVMQSVTYRPGLALSLTLFYAIGGEGQVGYLTIGALLAGIQGWLLYLILRALRVSIPIAGIAAGFLVVLPVVDATRLWLSAFPAQVAGVLYLLGVLVALHGLAGKTGRRAVAWHAGAAALYCAAVLTYELVAGLIVVTPLLYMVRSGWRPALRRWVPDLASIAVAMAILIPRGNAERSPHTSLGFIWDRANQTLTQADVVFRHLLPWPEVLGGKVGVLVLLLGMLGAGIAIGRRNATGAGLLGWVRIAGLSAVFSLAGLVMLLPAEPYYVPGMSGPGDRSGAAAAFGAVPLLVAVIVLGLGGLGALLRRPRVGFALAGVLILITGVNLAAREVHQQQFWTNYWQKERGIVANVGLALGGTVPANAAIVTFDEPIIESGSTAPFSASWDLKGAVWQNYSRPEVAARPWMPDTVCKPSNAFFSDEQPEERNFAYGKLFFVDVEARTATRIRDQASCKAIAAEMSGQPVS